KVGAGRPLNGSPSAFRGVAVSRIVSYGAYVDRFTARWSKVTATKSRAGSVVGSNAATEGTSSHAVNTRTTAAQYEPSPTGTRTARRAGHPLRNILRIGLLSLTHRGRCTPCSTDSIYAHCWAPGDRRPSRTACRLSMDRDRAQRDRSHPGCGRNGGSASGDRPGAVPSGRARTPAPGTGGRHAQHRCLDPSGQEA